jgi:hypothetical protein
MLTGASPSGQFSSEGLAYSFTQSARRGNTPYADLDAALVGLSIGLDNMNPMKSPLTYNSLFWCLRTGDAAGIAANLPNYTAENAWDMLIEAESGLEQP